MTIDEMSMFPGGLYTCRLTPPRCVDYVSPGFCALTGYEADELREMLAVETLPLVHPDDREAVRAQVAAMSPGADTCTLEYRFVMKTGEVRYAMDKMRVVRGSDGIVRGYAQFTDITDLRAKEQALHRGEQIMRSVATLSDRIAYIFSPSAGSLTALDAERSAANGLPAVCRGLEQCRTLNGLLLPESRRTEEEFFELLGSGVPTGSTRVRICEPGGSPRWLEVRFTAIPGDEELFVVSYFDVTMSHDWELSHLRLKSSMESDLAHCVLYYEVDLTENVVEKQGGSLVSRVQEFSGLGYDAVSKVLCERYLCGEERRLAESRYTRDGLLSLYEQGVGELSDDFLAVFSDGLSHWARFKTHIVKDPYSGHVKTLTIIMDVTEEKNLALTTLRMAERDAMTDLLRRGTAMPLMQSILDERNSCALMLIDLDDLKLINDTLGHPEGDRALIAIADAMRAHFRATDVLCRAGGDEFIVMLRQVADVASLRSILNTFLRRISYARIGSESDVSIHCSVGCAFTDGRESLSVDEMYRRADLALYLVKNNGKANYAFYSPELEDESSKPGHGQGVTLLSAPWRLPEELRQLFQAISTRFPLIIVSNLTKNTMYMLEYDGFSTRRCQESGEYSRLINQGAQTFAPEDREGFLAAFSLESLLAAHERGERIISQQGRQLGDDGIYRLIRTEYIFTDNEEGEITGISLSCPVLDN